MLTLARSSGDILGKVKSVTGLICRLGQGVIHLTLMWYSIPLYCSLLLVS